MNRQLVHPHPVHLRLATRAACVVAVLMTTASCGGDVSTAPPDPTRAPGSTTSELGVSGGQVTTTTTPGASADAPEVQELVNGLLLEPNSVYRLGGSFGSAGISFTFTAPETEVHSYVVPGLVALSADELGAVSLVNVLRRSGSLTYSVTSPDASSIISAEDLAAILAPPPADPFEWMVSRGYVDLGPIEESTFAGHPARTTEYEFLEIDDGVPCYTTDPRPCIWTFGSFDTSITYFPGERGTFIEVDVDGDPYLIDVRAQPGAADIAASFAITVDDVVLPDAVSDALEIPDVAPGAPAPEPLEPGSWYRWTSGDGRWYRFVAPAADETFAVANTGSPGDASLYVTAPADSLSIHTGSSLGWYPGALDEAPHTADTFEALISYLDSLEPGPFPDDLLGALRTLPHLVVTEPELRSLGDVEVTFVDVTIADSFGGGVTCDGEPDRRCVYLLGLAAPIREGHTVRIGVVPARPGGDPWYLFASTAHGATAAMIASVTIHEV